MSIACNLRSPAIMHGCANLCNLTCKETHNALRQSFFPCRWDICHFLMVAYNTHEHKIIQTMQLALWCFNCRCLCYRNPLHMAVVECDIAKPFSLTTGLLPVSGQGWGNPWKTDTLTLVNFDPSHHTLHMTVQAYVHVHVPHLAVEITSTHKQQWS